MSIVLYNRDDADVLGAAITESNTFDTTKTARGGVILGSFRRTNATTESLNVPIPEEQTVLRSIDDVEVAGSDLDESNTFDTTKTARGLTPIGALSRLSTFYLQWGPDEQAQPQPPSLVGTILFGGATLNAMNAPSLVGTISFGAIALTLHVEFDDGLEATAAFGEPTVSFFGMVVPGIPAPASFGSYKILEPGVAPDGLLAPGLFGAQRIAGSSVLPESLVSTILFGSQEVGGIKPESLVGTIAFGSHGVGSLIEFVEGLIGQIRFGFHNVLDADQDFALIIGGSNRNAVWYAVPGIEITYAPNGGSTIRFVIFDTTGAYIPEPGEECRFYMGTDLWFSGMIKSTEEQRVPDAAETAIATACIAADLASELLGRRVVYGFFEDEDPGFAVEVIETRFLREEGINSISGAAFNNAIEADRIYQPMLAFEFLNQIGGEIGADWFMDQYRQIFWFRQGEPWTPTDGLPYKQTYVDADLLEGHGSLTRKRTSGQYANKVFVQMGQANPSFSEEAFGAIPLDIYPGNSVFETTYPINVEPTITVYDDEPDAVGVNSLVLTDIVIGLLVPSTGWQALYVPGESFVTLNRTEVDAALGGAVKAVVVDYAVADGASPFVSYEDDDAIELRRVAEGGSTTGKYERVEQQTDVEDRLVAAEIAEKLVARYSAADGDVPEEISFETDLTEATGRILPGMSISCTFTRPAVSGSYMVERVSLREVESSLQASTPFLRASIQATNAGGVQFRPVQNIRAPRPKANIPIVFALSQDIGGSSNSGLALNDNRSQIVRQTGVIADAQLYFEEAPEGDAEAGDVLTVEIAHAPAATPTTFTTVGSLSCAVGSNLGTPKILDKKVRVNDVLRLTVTAVGTGGAKNGVLFMRQFI